MNIPNEQEPFGVPAVHLLGSLYRPHTKMRVGLSIDLDLSGGVEFWYSSVVCSIAADGGR